MAADKKSTSFDVTCTDCSRLAAFIADQRKTYPTYHNGPVAPFGDLNARLVIVGLAPGLHGANASGRPFTGDHAGLILYRTLHRHGFASHPESTSSNDGLQLLNCRITNAVKCVPPQNKPELKEIRACNRYLTIELGALSRDTVLIALGTIAHNAVMTALELRPKEFPFAHGNEYSLGNGLTLLDSYHCSRYNTQTRRLTEEMFEAVFKRARALVDAA